VDLAAEVAVQLSDDHLEREESLRARPDHTNRPTVMLATGANSTKKNPARPGRVTPIENKAAASRRERTRRAAR
jgi:hypothetical protein